MPELTFLEASRAASLAVGELADATMRRGGLPGGFYARPESFGVVRRGREWFAVARVEVQIGTVHVAEPRPEAADG